MMVFSDNDQAVKASQSQKKVDHLINKMRTVCKEGATGEDEAP